MSSSDGLVCSFCLPLPPAAFGSLDGWPSLSHSTATTFLAWGFPSGSGNSVPCGRFLCTTSSFLVMKVILQSPQRKGSLPGGRCDQR
uniref:Putative secreted protein n=1 Tax=Ixodes ricinus TaxID=34613 RepID=A0A147BR33_IXORI